MKKNLVLFIMVLMTVSSAFGNNIFKAVTDGDLEQVKQLVSENRGVVKKVDRTKRTPVHLAAAGGKYDILAYLLNNGGDGNAKNAAGTTPLHFAAFNGHLKCVELLVKAGAAINAKNRQVTTPMLLAVSKNHLNVVEFLLKNGADVNALDREQGTPIHTAAQRGYDKIADMLLKHGADPCKIDVNLRTAMHFAPFGGSLEIVKMLHRKGCDFRKADRLGKTPLYNALIQGKTDIAGWLMDQKVALKKFRTKDGSSYLHAAVIGGKPELVSRLLESGVTGNNRNAYNATPYTLAVNKKKEEIIRLLKQKGMTEKPAKKNPVGLYFGQTPPGMNPEIFAPGIITNQETIDRDICYTSDLKTLYFTQNWKIKETRLENNGWSEPRNILDGKFPEAEAFLTPDEKKIFCISRRPESGKGRAATWEVWMIGRDPGENLEPEMLGDPFSGCFYTTFTSNWRMYYTGVGNDIYYSQWKDGKFLKPVKLGNQINTPQAEYNSFIAPDESYLIFTSAGMKEHFGGGDIYIAFRNSDGSWSHAVNMGPKVNSSAHDYCPSVSPDGKYFFFSSTKLGNNDDVYWMSADIIKNLKRNPQK